MSSTPETPFVSEILLKPAEVLTYLNISRTTLWRQLETDPNFPPKIIFSKRCIRFRKSALDAYLLKKEGKA